MEFKDEPPRSASLTGYDVKQAPTYLRLLDASQAGASWQEVVREVFKLDPATDPARLERMHRAHLERAEWVRAQGYQELSRNGSLLS